MSGKRRIEVEEAICTLLQTRPEVGVHDVAQYLNLSKSNESNRKTIRRAFESLIKKGVLEAKGQARARVYMLKKLTESSKLALSSGELAPLITQHTSAFKGIQLSKASQELIKYLAKPLQARAPVGFNQEFLRSYKPNKTLYFSDTQRAQLHKMGRVENTQRPAGTYARKILDRLLIDLSWNSSRLEGNTYSLLETKQLIEVGESALGKNLTETQMILNHKGAIEFIIESANEKKISKFDICSIHALLSENLLGDPGASGRLRNLGVNISGSTYFPLDNPHIITECFDSFVEKINCIDDPFEQSLFSLVHLSYLQAFEDVNKRTARLTANIPLIKSNLRPLSFTDVDPEAYATSLIGVYENNDISLIQDLFLWAYERSAQKYSAIQQSMGEPNVIKLKYRNELTEIMRTIILSKVSGKNIVIRLTELIKSLNLEPTDASELFKIAETEIISLHEGNIARFKIRPSEFQKWKKMQ